MNWEEIRALYNKAWNCLCGPKHVSQWSRDEENGMFYLWNAFHYAKTTKDPETDHLTYARILRLMACEVAAGRPEYDRFHEFVLPAWQEYKKAIGSGQKAGDRELEFAKREAEQLDYQLKHEDYTKENWKETIALIKNGDLIDKTGFRFHDSKPVGFELTSDNKAVLKLQYDKLLAVFRFENIAGIKISTDPEADWVSDFYCYKDMDSESMTFDIEYYRIICEKIVLEKIVGSDEDKKALDEQG